MDHAIVESLKLMNILLNPKVSTKKSEATPKNVFFMGREVEA